MPGSEPNPGQSSGAAAATDGPRKAHKSNQSHPWMMYDRPDRTKTAKIPSPFIGATPNDGGFGPFQIPDPGRKIDMTRRTSGHFASGNPKPSFPNPRGPLLWPYTERFRSFREPLNFQKPGGSPKPTPWKSNSRSVDLKAIPYMEQGPKPKSARSPSAPNMRTGRDWPAMKFVPFEVVDGPAKMHSFGNAISLPTTRTGRSRDGVVPFKLGTQENQLFERDLKSHGTEDASRPKTVGPPIHRDKYFVAYHDDFSKFPGHIPDPFKDDPLWNASITESRAGNHGNSRGQFNNVLGNGYKTKFQPPISVPWNKSRPPFSGQH